MAERIGDSGDPWGVPQVGWKGSEEKPLKHIRAVWSVMKLRIHLIVEGSTPRSAKVTAVRSGARWSKNQEMSKRRTVPIYQCRIVSLALYARLSAASGAE
jgi:hypothetical protein